MENKGLFISLEGIDGCGKTSVKQGLLQYFSEFPVLSIREPGGTLISEKIREILLNEENREITARTEAFLYAAARSQLVEELILPALLRGKIVLADRYLDSTIAYQGYGRGLDLGFLTTLNQLGTSGLKPRLTLLLDIDPAEAQRRKKKDIPDRLEKEGIEFQSRVREGYLKIAREEPERIKLLDAGKDFKEVLQEAIKYIEDIWPAKSWP
ncbi:MAG TPA: dTMP kinase [Syntrophomonas wolfei]|uniref:Thymidylate kinase n=2 Tax=Syntrophomonas wolfei TaxID=863 RepID=A0A354Z0Y2_9FIRM|nr:dTMP kinase [Syntrophomonas wolfei]